MKEYRNWSHKRAQEPVATFIFLLLVPDKLFMKRSCSGRLIQVIFSRFLSWVPIIKKAVSGPYSRTREESNKDIISLFLGIIRESARKIWMRS
ncbi:MAG: hypothetical protein KAS94_10550 [Desulfobulbaceae bacterium]|nr:hypothetical protein [Desulfobulbaceae bacterium]